jgi:hypothetical protein
MGYRTLETPHGTLTTTTRHSCDPPDDHTELTTMDEFLLVVITYSLVCFRLDDRQFLDGGMRWVPTTGIWIKFFLLRFGNNWIIVFLPSVGRSDGYSTLTTQPVRFCITHRQHGDQRFLPQLHSIRPTRVYQLYVLTYCYAVMTMMMILERLVCMDQIGVNSVTSF